MEEPLPRQSFIKVKRRPDGRVAVTAPAELWDGSIDAMAAADAGDAVTTALFPAGSDRAEEAVALLLRSLVGPLPEPPRKTEATHA